MSDYDRHGWLAQTTEVAIDADRPIVDPHHHLWDRDGSTYLAAELLADTSASHNVSRTVFVECGSGYEHDADAALAPVGETRFVVHEAEKAAQSGSPIIAAIVGHADMRLGESVEAVLAAHDAAGAGLFRGIRHGTNLSKYPDVRTGHHSPTPLLMGDPTFRAGVTKLADMGFSFDAWLYFDQLGELAEMAAAIPQCSIILNHLGAPLGVGPYASARDEMLEVWDAGMVEVAACPNVTLKVGGLGMEHYFGTDWGYLPKPPGSEEVAAHWRDIVHRAIDVFGPRRCMFESNFPVDRQTLPYTVLWNAFQILAAEYDDAEQDALFFETAARSYRI